MRFVLQSAVLAGLLSAVMGWSAGQCLTEKYRGCYVDGGDRTLGHYQEMGSLTVEMCIGYCQARGFKYAGVEYYRECYCGDGFSYREEKRPDHECNTKCEGSSQMCGGPWRVSVYTTNVNCPSLPCAEQLHQTPAGKCCPTCKPGCYVDNVGELATGKSYEDQEQCKTCVCNGNDQVTCTYIPCPLLPCEEQLHQTLAGQCCPTCKPGCYVDNVGELATGESYEDQDQCETCICNGNDQVTCTPIVCEECTDGYIPDITVETQCCPKCRKCPVCPKLNCKQKYQFQDEGMCCPDCMCSVKKELFKPGPVGDMCDGCECANGEITCNPVKCMATTELNCVDPVKGDDCCYSCPQGETCRYQKKKKNIVIRKGKTESVGKKLCMCSPTFWWPNAFCTDTKVNPKSFTGIEDGDSYKGVVQPWSLPSK